MSFAKEFNREVGKKGKVRNKKKAINKGKV